MDVILSAISISLYLALLYSGRTRLAFGRYLQAVASLTGISVLVASVYLLGWVGIFILAAVSVVAFLVRVSMLAMAHEDILVRAQVHGAFGSREEALAFPAELRRSDQCFLSMDPVELDRLVERLAERGRREHDIRQMAASIVKLHKIFNSELVGLIDRFDRLMRIWNKAPSEADYIADVLTTTTQKSAATFDEVLDAMIAAATPD